MKTGNTWVAVRHGVSKNGPQWSPVMKTGNTRGVLARRGLHVTRLNGARS